MEEVKEVEASYHGCYEEFNPELPRLVKEDRKIRLQARQAAGNKLKRPAQIVKPGGTKAKPVDAQEEDRKTGVYYMIGVNCRYRSRIRKLLAQAKEVGKKRKNLNEDYEEMRKEVFKIRS